MKGVHRDRKWDGFKPTIINVETLLTIYNLFLVFEVPATPCSYELNLLVEKFAQCCQHQYFLFCVGGPRSLPEDDQSASEVFFNFEFFNTCIWGFVFSYRASWSYSDSKKAWKTRYFGEFYCESPLSMFLLMFWNDYYILLAKRWLLSWKLKNLCSGIELHYVDTENLSVMVEVFVS